MAPGSKTNVPDSMPAARRRTPVIMIMAVLYCLGAGLSIVASAMVWPMISEGEAPGPSAVVMYWLPAAVNALLYLACAVSLYRLRHEALWFQGCLLVLIFPGQLHDAMTYELLLPVAAVGVMTLMTLRLAEKDKL